MAPSAVFPPRCRHRAQGGMPLPSPVFCSSAPPGPRYLSVRARAKGWVPVMKEAGTPVGPASRRQHLSAGLSPRRARSTPQLSTATVTGAQHLRTPLPAARRARGWGPPRTWRRRGGLRSSGREKGGVTCRAGSRGLGSSWRRSCRSGRRERRWGARLGAAPPPWRLKRSSTGSTRPPAGPLCTRWGAAVRPGSTPGVELGAPLPSSSFCCRLVLHPPAPAAECMCPSCEGPAGQVLPSASLSSGSELSLLPFPLPSRSTLRDGSPLRSAPLPLSLDAEGPEALLCSPKAKPLLRGAKPLSLLLPQGLAWVARAVRRLPRMAVPRGPRSAVGLGPPAALRVSAGLPGAAAGQRARGSFLRGSLRRAVLALRFAWS